MKPAALCLAGALFAHSALACAPVGRNGDQLSIEREEAVIVWDAKNKIQHFIRRASFAGAKGKDFGFLVPTPTVPTLAEANDAAFRELSVATQPRTVEVPTNDRNLVDAVRMASAEKAGVSVVATQRVAGYDAAVLDSSDAASLDRWLKANGYLSGPELQAWFKPYIDRRWKITAFKIAGGAEKRVLTQAVRMSFATDRPFFPYREPERKGVVPGKGPGRMLRVYFLADARYAARVGKGGAEPAQTVWSNKLPKEWRQIMQRHFGLSDQAAPGTDWLTEFEDHMDVRPGVDELYFRRDARQNTLEREPVKRYVYRP